MKSFLFTFLMVFAAVGDSQAEAALPSAPATATCKTMNLVATDLVPQGSYLIACTDGTSGLVWNGVNQEIYPLVSYCPISFNTSGSKIALNFLDFFVVVGDINYQIVVSSTNANMFALLPLLPGSYKALHGSTCSFTVFDDGSIHINN